MTAAWRAAALARACRPATAPPAAAVAGAVSAPVLRAAGWQVVGRLPTSPYDTAPGGPFPQGPGRTAAEVPDYADLDELLSDDSVDAVALDATDPDLARALPLLRRAGLLLLLTTPAPLEPDLLRAALAEPGPGSVVALLQRAEPWARTVAAALPLAGGPVLQVTVRGWPPGAASAAELVDLVQGWCGDVVAVAAAPAALPATALPGGARVSWSLLTATGATVLVSPDDAPPLARLSFAGARLEAGPLGARWAGGAELPLLATPAPEVPDGPRPSPVPPGTPAGLLAAAVALRAAAAVGEARTDARVETRAGAPGGRPRPADLGDLAALARVLEALRESTARGALVRTA